MELINNHILSTDGSVQRDCMRLYTGGEAFRVCYTSMTDGTTCLCSRELCNASEWNQSHLGFAKTLIFAILMHLMQIKFLS